jgi:hypothetical protein
MALAKKKKVAKPPEKITFTQCEWVIQFDNDEPQIFATADETTENPDLVIRLQNTSESHMTFVDSTNNKSFKIYAREKK